MTRYASSVIESNDASVCVTSGKDDATALTSWPIKESPENCELDSLAASVKNVNACSLILAKTRTM